MSIRIHELARRFNMEGKDMLSLLRERGYVSADTRSVSSTVANIYVEEIEKELASKLVSSAPAAEAAPAAASAPEVVAEPAKAPTGVFVKSAQDVVREKEAAAAAAKAAAAAPKAPPAPPPIASAPPAAPALPVAPARPVSAPPTLPPRPVSAPPAIVKAPAPVAPLSSPRPLPVTPQPIPAQRPVAVAPQSAAGPVHIVTPIAPSRALSAPPSLSAPLARPAGGPPPVPRANVAPAAVTPPTITEVNGVKTIHLKPPIIVRDFAAALSMRPFQLISELMQMGIFAAITQSLDEAVAVKVAEKHGFLLEIKHRGDVATQQAAKEKQQADKAKPAVVDDEKNLVTRPPVVVILGHVDHGKTSLLDAIRKADVAAGEAGGITQHIGAYQIEFNGRKITFLDTPGHAAFNKMRARGANSTDIGILVVAADDGFMPQTDEALQHAKNAKLPVIVAVNKMDVKGANLDSVKAQMQAKGIAPEDWGGETITVPVSAIKGTGINELLEMILLQADVLELKANPKVEATGVIIESQIDVGRGPLATVLVQRGTLKVGDSLVCGPHWAKVRAMFDDLGKPLKEAPPSTPARVIGWSGTPDSGGAFRVVKNAREAENLADEENMRLKKESANDIANQKDVSVEKLFANIAATQAKVLGIILKTDVFGSTEAVQNILENIKSTKVSLKVLSTDVGLISKNDVIMAAAAGAVIIGFNTKLENGVTPLAKHHGVRIETFEIIYELGDKVREMMADMLDPDLKEVKLGAAEVRATFPLAKGFVAGCLVTEGKITRNASSRLRRGKESVYEGKVETLKRFKDDANEVRAGLECGIKLDDFNGYQVGDVIECFEIQKVRASL